MDYEVAWAIQKERVSHILSHGTGGHGVGGGGRCACLSCANLLILLEHPSVYTMGRSGQWQDVLSATPVAGSSPTKPLGDPQGLAFSQQDLAFSQQAMPAQEAISAQEAEAISAQEAIPVIVTDRGGKVTYHGPGQLVAYVVCDLRPYALASVRQHVTRLEETAIQTLSFFGVFAQRDLKNPGIWVENVKIGALGVRIRRGVAYHGVAINRDLDLRPFRGIIPCGLAHRAVTSLANLGVHVSRMAFEAQFLVAFREVFDANLCIK